MAKALLIVDYNNDFVADQGVLTSGAAGQAADPLIRDLISQTLAAGDYVFVCNDEHDPADTFHPENSLFPAHSQKGAWGAELYGQTGQLCRKLLAEGHPRVCYLPKYRFSAFRDTPLETMLRARNIDSLALAGVCTDICVLHTAIDAAYAGFAVTVHQAACATPIPLGQEWALNHLQAALGATLV